MNWTHSQAKQTINQMLTTGKTISLPEIRSPDQTVLQNRMVIEFDSFERIDRAGSVVDFIIRKGGGEVLVGLCDGWLRLTDQHRERIEGAGKSFMILRIDLTDDWAKTLYCSTNPREVLIEPFGTLEHHTQTAYWVYHNRYGWQNGAQ